MTAPSDKKTLTASFAEVVADAEAAGVQPAEFSVARAAELVRADRDGRAPTER